MANTGTGNGQVALLLSKSFKNVYASDISAEQLAQAQTEKNICYSLEPAENTSFSNNSFDLITVAQAIHWFDFTAFNTEVQRVLKPNGIIAIWGYSLLRINPEIDEIIDNFYNTIIGTYWNKERHHVDAHYKTIVFDFDEIKVTQKFEIHTQWTLSHLKGYFNSWSSVQNYITLNQGDNPVDSLIKEISTKWKSESRSVKFPIFLRIGRHKK